jgi:hypothetical protein
MDVKIIRWNFFTEHQKSSKEVQLLQLCEQFLLGERILLHRMNKVLNINSYSLYYAINVGYIYLQECSQLDIFITEVFGTLI